MGKLKLLRLGIIIIMLPVYAAAFMLPKPGVKTLSSNDANLLCQRKQHHGLPSLQLFTGKHAAAITQSTSSAVVSPSLGPIQLAFLLDSCTCCNRTPIVGVEISS